jgi:hypothetical protein
MNNKFRRGESDAAAAADQALYCGRLMSKANISSTTKNAAAIGASGGKVGPYQEGFLVRPHRGQRYEINELSGAVIRMLFL